MCPDRVRLSVRVRDEVVSSEFKEPLVLFFNTPSADLQGEIIVRNVAGSDGLALQTLGIGNRLPVNNQGAATDSLALTVGAPEIAGIYGIDIQSGGASIAENQPRLMVQRD